MTEYRKRFYQPTSGEDRFCNCLGIFAFILILASCNLPRSAPTSTSVPGNPQNCYFNWASQPLPELSASVQSAINSASLKGVSAKAEAYGENCIDPQSNKPLRFAVLETDFRVAVTVSDLGNTTDLGNRLEKILGVLDAFEVGAIPGTQPGYIFVTYRNGSDELNVSFTVIAGKSARAAGLHGSALLQELQNK